MIQYKLSAALESHEDDVRAVVAPFNDTIVSASRDCTVRVWSKDPLWTSKINLRSSGFVNSVAFDLQGNMVISGGQEKLINITDLFSSDVEAKYVLVGHESNVCALDTDGDQIISGSWDTTAKVWENHVLKYNLEGHSASVWDVKILGDDRYLTCSADKTVKLWDKNKEVKTIVGHTDVVRSLALLPNGIGFASASNDGTVRLTDFEGNLLHELVGHDSFVYSVNLLSNGDIVTSGEDRTVRIWRDGKAIQIITLPCVSVWTVAVSPNDDIVTGSSDNVVRIFTRDAERVASENELESFRKSVESMALNSHAFDESKLLGPETLERPGNKEGQVIVVKSYTGVNEAHQWTEGQWVKVGEVVGGSTSDKKQEFEGKKWDFVFDVDVQEGVPPLKLPYNNSENPYVAASRFLERYELPTSYTDQIVLFITQNTQGVTINQASDFENPYADKRREKLLPHTEYLGFTTNNSDSIFKGIKKFNETENTFDEASLQSIERSLKSGQCDPLLDIAGTIIHDWSNKLPGFDILRLIIDKTSQPPKNLSNFIRIGLDPSQPPTYFMTLRMICNIFLNRKWGEAIITDISIVSKVLNILRFDSESFGKHGVNIANAISTLILNYSVYTSRYKVKKLAELLAEKMESLGEAINPVSSEATYRFSVAFGNLIYVDRSLKNEGFFRFQANVKYQEQRFTDVFEDIAEL
jgi:phospholipase A-2-activating protein